jgi:Mat/Ecp fimbriae major subunit
MHKTIRLTTAGAAFAAAFALTASANAATATGNATAEILSALSVVEDAGLDFAQIAVNGAGTVTVGTGATPVDSCSAQLVCAGTKSRGVFTVSGAPGIGVTASVQEASITLTSGANTMTVDGFTIYWPTGTTLDASGNRSFDVGATLHVGAAQATGVYNGTYTVDVAYN